MYSVSGLSSLLGTRPEKVIDNHYNLVYIENIGLPQLNGDYMFELILGGVIGAAAMYFLAPHINPVFLTLKAKLEAFEQNAKDVVKEVTEKVDEAKDLVK
jgi:hypothetical protein